MSEIVLLDLDSPKPQSSVGKRSAISSWGESNNSDKEEVPIHLFLSPTHNGSTRSSSSVSSRAKERRQKKFSQETDFSSVKKSSKDKKTEFPTTKKNSETVLSSPERSQEYSSSESEDCSSSRSKSKKMYFHGKAIRTNKVHDYKVQEENKESKINEREQNFRMKSSQPKKESKNLFSGDSSADIETKRSVTSISDMSYKDRIRDRFNTMKERAVESLSRPQSRSQSRLKSLVLKQGGIRMEDFLKQEEDEVLAAIERHEKMKLHWQEISKGSIEREPNFKDECVTFFGETQEKISPCVTPAEEIKSPSKPESSVGIQEDAKMLTSELLGIRDDWEMVEFSKPKITAIKNKKLWEEKLFSPSAEPVSLENKIEPGLTPRYLEEEGIYVGKKIQIRNRIKNKMEQRILMCPESRKWFGRDGEMISSTCPIKLISTRPYFDEEVSQTCLRVFKPATLGTMSHRYMDLSGNLNYVLDIDISSIEFTHHPLFSREHVLVQRLKDLYVKYKKKKETDNLNRLSGRLNALRKTRDNIRNICNEGGDDLNLRDKLQKYEDDIKEVRQMRYAEGRMDKQLTNKIMMTWKDLVKLREQQGYQNTSLKLNIIKNVEEDSKEKKNKWDSDIKQEVKEVVEELRKSYKKALDVFNEKHEIWCRSNKKKVRDEEATENEDSIERLSDTESTNESGSEREEILEKEPKPPKPVVVADVRSQVMKNYKESFRQPGEPEIEFHLSKATNVDASAYHNKEELRRAAVKRCMVFIKLFYNGKEVCRSKSQSLGQNFDVTISQRFAIRILEWPESLMIEIHEEIGTLNRSLLVTGIYIPFPDSFTTIHNSEIVRYEFSSKISVSYHHTAVGSGNKIIPCPDGNDFNNQPVCLNTSGTVACRVGWVNNRGKILAPPEKYWTNKKENPTSSFLEILKSGGTFDLTKLKDWAENSKLDPNDPYNSAFFHFLENAGDFEETKPSYFRLNPLLDAFDFCHEKDIQNNIRLELLKFRDMGEPEFRDMKMIPLDEKQIHKDIFKDYEKRKSKPYPLTDILTSDPLDGHRAWGKNYLKEVQQKLLKQCRMSKQNRRFQEIITEESVPDIGTLGLTFMKWLRPKRPLRPVRKERKKITPQNLSGQEINIVVNVVRAFEVPVRKDVDSMSTSESIEGFPLVNVRPFVEISFRGVSARTTAAEGANPTWNQDLQIPLTSKSGSFSSGSLQSIKDTLYLHLFDEMVIDLIEDESTRETNIHQRLERHWLASMKIPFPTLYFNSRIEGTFKLYSPPVLLGYEREAHRRQFSGSAGQEPLLPQRDATYITLFVTVQPGLNPPKPIMEKIESSESATLEKHLEGWQHDITNLVPHRKIKTLVLDITGKSVCVTRFIKSVSPPPIAKEKKITPEMAARFVAMIPSMTQGVIFPGIFDIWLAGDQILRLLCGNSEDHATLLCSYFLNLGLNAYVLIGSGIPHGTMAYVLEKKQVNKNSTYYVWDPINGQKYNVDDSFCPLQKVYFLFNDQNIWANVQAEEMPRRTKFDLTKKVDWFPAFGKNITAPSESIQPQSLHYKTTSRQAVEILQDKIEKKLRDSLMKWRKKSRTQWNRYCAATLRKLLPKLEESTWNLGEDNSPDHILELQHILASHKMCGFPINMAYTNIEAVIEAVKATGVHCNENEELEFALAVYIHPYPNDVLSVWVYVASLVRRR